MAYPSPEVLRLWNPALPNITWGAYSSRYEWTYLPDMSEQNRFFSLADIQPGHQVLDLGCATGRLALKAAVAIGPTGFVVCLDKDSSMLDVVRGKMESVPESIRQRILPLKADIANLVDGNGTLMVGTPRTPFRHPQNPAVAGFDRILVRSVLHLMDPRIRVRLLQEWATLLSPSGRLILEYSSAFMASLISIEPHPLFQHCLDIDYPADQSLPFLAPRAMNAYLVSHPLTPLHLIEHFYPFADPVNWQDTKNEADSLAASAGLTVHTATRLDQGQPERIAARLPIDIIVANANEEWRAMHGASAGPYGRDFFEGMKREFVQPLETSQKEQHHRLTTLRLASYSYVLSRNASAVPQPPPAT